MVETIQTPSEQSLYVCWDCGDPIESPENASICPACGGRLKNTTVAHD